MNVLESASKLLINIIKTIRNLALYGCYLSLVFIKIFFKIFIIYFIKSHQIGFKALLKYVKILYNFFVKMQTL